MTSILGWSYSDHKLILSESRVILDCACAENGKSKRHGRIHASHLRIQCLQTGNIGLNLTMPRLKQNTTKRTNLVEECHPIYACSLLNAFTNCQQVRLAVTAI